MENELHPDEGLSLEELAARLDASKAAYAEAYAGTAITNLAFTATYAARFALGCLAKPYEMGQDAWRVDDESREAVALVLESIATAVRTPGLVAENFSPIRFDEF